MKWIPPLSQKHQEAYNDGVLIQQHITLHYRIEGPDRLLNFENFYKRVALIQ